MVYGDHVYRNYSFPNIVLGLQVFQSGANIFLIFLGSLYFSILLSKEFCHPNFTLLLIIQPILHYISLTAKLVRSICSHFNLLTPVVILTVNSIGDVAISTTCIILIGFGIERIYAMRNINNYDSQFRPIPWLGIILAFAALFYSIFLIVTWYTTIITSECVYILQAILFSSTSFFFYGIKLSSVKAYRIVAERRTSTVNDRYVTAKNLKAAQLVMILAPYKCISSILVLVFYFLVFDQAPEHLVPLFSEAYFVFLYVQITVQILLLLMCHQSLREQFYIRISKFRGKSNRVLDASSVQSVIGQKMIFSLEEESKMYFESLNKTWESHTQQKSGRHDKYVTAI